MLAVIRLTMLRQREGLRPKICIRTRRAMNGERRRRARLKLHCGIQLCSVDDHRIVKTETDDLNSEGFYCISDQPFSPGEHLECDLVTTVDDMSFQSPSLVLHRRARVLRVEVRGLEPGFGIACQFV